MFCLFANGAKNKMHDKKKIFFRMCIMINFWFVTKAKQNVIYNVSVLTSLGIVHIKKISVPGIKF